MSAVVIEVSNLRSESDITHSKTQTRRGVGDDGRPSPARRGGAGERTPSSPQREASSGGNGSFPWYLSRSVIRRANLDMQGASSPSGNVRGGCRGWIWEQGQKLIEWTSRNWSENFRPLTTLVGSPPETPSPIPKQKNPPAKPRQNEKRWGEGGTPERLAEAWRNLLISSLSFVQNKFEQRTLFHHKLKALASTPFFRHLCPSVLGRTA